MEEQKKSQSSMILVAVAVVAVAAVGGLALMQMRNTSEPMTTSQSMEARPTQTATTMPGGQMDGAVKNGTYTADGMYQSPGGQETVSVTLMVVDGMVTDAEFKGNATLAASVRFQGMFAENYKQMVVGKPLAELRLDKVSGSSLTPKGFNDAVAKILEQSRS